MKNVLTFFGIIALAIIAFIGGKTDWLTPAEAEIMIIGLIVFAGWYTQLQLRKEKDA